MAGPSCTDEQLQTEGTWVESIKALPTTTINESASASDLALGIYVIDSSPSYTLPPGTMVGMGRGRGARYRTTGSRLNRCLKSHIQIKVSLCDSVINYKKRRYRRHRLERMGALLCSDSMWNAARMPSMGHSNSTHLGCPHQQ